MTPDDYQKLARRTQCPQSVILQRLDHKLEQTTVEDRIAILHATIGISGESGELSSALQRWLWYGKPLDLTNVKEELGDLLWYIAELCNGAGWRMEDIMSANIAKLRARYPEKFSNHNAAEENRDRQTEREVIDEVMDQTGAGFAEPPDDSIVGTGVDSKEMPHVGFGDGLVHGDRIVGMSYTDFCLRCSKPVHKNNQSGLCPDCYQDKIHGRNS